MLQTGYTSFIKLIEAPDYRQFEDVHSIYKDPVWNTETRKNKAELARVAFYHCDQVGTPHSLSNELGECVWEMTQDTWGTALAIKASEHLLEQTNLRFQGQYYDSETGLHYNRYRYYEPYSARYVSKDPIGLFGGLNNSAYVMNPTKNIDALGLSENENNKSNEWITKNEKELLGKPFELAKKNIVTTANNAVLIGNQIKKTSNDVINGAQVVGDNIKQEPKFYTLMQRRVLKIYIMEPFLQLS